MTSIWNSPVFVKSEKQENGQSKNWFMESFESAQKKDQKRQEHRLTSYVCGIRLFFRASTRIGSRLARN
ncbi:hypothetical protein KSF_099390 [Reticulibacter mediterranei]|uniref:Uncharacterized protein n=1 Tax=Reticulibacter mediterranei TaxID=2778369 RepID=A0A8J3J344_9CHLR|nr:hypothetical protein KSF_099390 [Reticulibacter mediterranei]